LTQFADFLAQRVLLRRTPVMVGLDPRADQLPACVLGPQTRPDSATVASAYREFCRGVIDVVAPLVAVVKPQVAFFEQLGPAGMAVLSEVIHYAQARELIVVVDGKRNDIGSTAAAYAEGWLGRGQSPWGADALTVSPYLGDDSLQPFIDVARAREAGVFVLVKTSNPGGPLLQDLQADGQTVYARVARVVREQSEQSRGRSGYGLVGAVVGATYPEQLAELRGALPGSWLLVPGYGSQGGSARDVAAAFDDQGLGAIINNSRGIIFAHTRPEYRDRYGDGQWQSAVEAATREMMEELRGETPAGRLART